MLELGGKSPFIVCADADLEAAVEGAMREAEALLDTFSALLRIAQVEGASPRAGFRDVDLSAAVEAVADAYRPDAEDAGHRLCAEVTPGLAVHGDQELLTQAAANLVENALRHTPAGTRIGIRLSRGHGGVVRLVVEDDGPGIPPGEMERVFEPFHRLEASRNRGTGGTGLGLTIARRAVEGHGGTIALANRPGGGLLVTVRLPRADGMASEGGQG